MKIQERFKNAWNAFTNRDPTEYYNPSDYRDYGVVTTYRPDRPRFTRGNEKTIVSSVYNRIALDVAAVSIKHVRLDEQERYIETINSGLNNCLAFEANIDQTGRSLIQDIVMSMFDEGAVAVVPITTSINPKNTTSYEILEMRTGKVVEWMPSHVKIRLYDDRNGKHREIILPKKMVALIENPLYAVINEPNSTMQRLIRKLALLDVVDEQMGSGKLDLIISLPYIVKTPARRQQAEERKKDLENQLRDSKLGIAYTDGSEKITQLNRSLENNLLAEVESLTSMLYSQLGITAEIMNGTADETSMLNYTSRTLEPILSAIIDEFNRKFLTKTARSQKQIIMYFNNPFKLVPIAQLADAADRFTRNEIVTSNEFRQILGMKPVQTERADELVNKNMPVQDMPGAEVPAVQDGLTDQYFKSSLSELDKIDESLSELEKEANAK